MPEHYTINSLPSLVMASEKKAFVLRIQPDILKGMEKWAADEFRSVNGQIEYLLQQALKDSGRWKEKKAKKED